MQCLAKNFVISVSMKEITAFIRFRLDARVPQVGVSLIGF